MYIFLISYYLPQNWSSICVPSCLTTTTKQQKDKVLPWWIYKQGWTYLLAQEYNSIFSRDSPAKYIKQRWPGQVFLRTLSHPYFINAKAAMIVKALISTRADISWMYKKIFTISKDLALFKACEKLPDHGKLKTRMERLLFTFLVFSNKRCSEDKQLSTASTQLTSFCYNIDEMP